MTSPVVFGTVHFYKAELNVILKSISFFTSQVSDLKIRNASVWCSLIRPVDEQLAIGWVIFVIRYRIPYGCAALRFTIELNKEINYNLWRCLCMLFDLFQVTPMDLHGALSALMRPLTTMQPSSTFPLTSFLQHPLMSPLTFPLSTNPMDSTLLDITVSDSQSTITPRKTRLESPSSPLSQSSTVSSTQLSSPQPSPIRKFAKPIPDEKKVNTAYNFYRDFYYII
ncbi:hypothetical protein DICVIV_06753 [Dictyocaulus viviparus]|uniref:Uncharacterized protein n=1 Tax=Dictyocaulus viviparus TaxID=29172 RepID=A0A0D8XRL6_DICVI|nr:hypothetical protein DICVIV_06753 [Dictyocaulus viviparus]